MKDIMLVILLTLVVSAAGALKTDINLVEMKKLNTAKVYMTQN